MLCKSGKYLSISLVLILSLILEGCGGGKTSSRNVQQARKFPSMEVPGMITDPAEMVDYAAEHFWDRFLDTSFTGRCDSALVSGVTRQEVENSFGTYSAILWQTEFQSSRKIRKI